MLSGYADSQRSKRLQQSIHQMFGCCRFVFNHFLKLWNDTYTASGEGLSYNTCATQLPATKGSYEWQKSVDSIALQSSVRNVADIFDRFFKKKDKAPRFKSRKNPVQSFTTKTTNGNIAIDGTKIKLPKLGWIRFANSSACDGSLLALPCVVMRQANILFPSSVRLR